MLASTVVLVGSRSVGRRSANGRRCAPAVAPIAPGLAAAIAVGSTASTYHWLLERFPSLDTCACSSAIPCEFVWFEKFGFVTLPFLAGCGVLAVLALVTLPQPPRRIEEWAMPNQPNARKAKSTPAFAKPPTGPPHRPLRGRSPARTAVPTGGRPARPSRTVWITVAVVAVLAVAAAVIAIVSSGGSSEAVSPPGMEQTQPVTVTGSALVALPEDSSAADPAVGQVAPTLSGLSFDGSPVDLKPAQTSATFVVFPALRCPHCQREMPKLVQWDEDSKVPAGVNVVGIATATSADQPNYPPSTWLSKAGFPWPVMADSATGNAATALGISSWPGFVLIGKDGTVLWRASGEIDVTDLAAKITAALPKAA